MKTKLNEFAFVTHYLLTKGTITVGVSKSITIEGLADIKSPSCENMIKPGTNITDVVFTSSKTLTTESYKRIKITGHE